MRSSVVRELFLGHVDVGAAGIYPQLSRGRLAQLEPLLARLRQAESSVNAIELLRDLDLLVRPTQWPTLVLSRVVQQLATVDTSAALSLIVHLSLGARLLQRFATEPQLRALSPPAAPVFAFALTEASPGSDVSQIQTYAEPVPGGYRISGVKSWVTNASFATHFLVFARTTPQHAGNKPRLTAFLLPAGPSISVTPISGEVLPSAGVGAIHFDRSFVPEEGRIGAFGKGFRVLMSGLAEARLLLGAAATGACLRAFNDTVARLNQRRAFGRPVGNFPSVQDRVTSMLSDVLSLESLVHAVAGFDVRQRGVDPVERAVVRLAASRTSGRVLDAARELFGAAAFVGSATSARRWTDTRALTLLDGSDSALESYIVLEGTREIRRRLSVMASSSDPLARLDAWGSHASSRLRARVQRVLTRDVPGVSNQRLVGFVMQLGEQVQQELRAHGRELVERQHVHRRLAHIVTELATWEALSSRVSAEIAQRGQVGSRRMVEAAEIWMESAAARLQVQFEALQRNDDALRDRIASRVYTDGAYPFDIL